MKYRLTEKIGSGGMAEVFRATGEGPEGFERSFVIKRIHPRLSEATEFVRMFVDEAKISARLIHPNIVQVFEFAHQAGGYYIVMEPVDGVDMGTLMRRLEQRREVPPPVFVAEVGRQACRGLEFAHTLSSPDGKSLGIVHRDVTPPNIMVAWNGTVKILDFGIARAVQEIRTNLTEAGMVKGKMAYVAPELLQGKTADARSDVFSLGVVLHGLLSGRQLFQGENDLETLKMVQEMDIPPPSVRNPGVKRALDGIVMRALERDPARRYRSAGDMGDDLEGVVLRERYSTRALARKARELVPPEGTPVPEAVGGESSAPTSLGERDAMVVVDEAPSRPTALPPPPPAEDAGPAPWRAATAPRRAADRAPRSVIGAGVPWVIAAALAGMIVARPLERALGLRLPWAGARAPVAVTPPPAPVTVRVALDSTPQGAQVIVAPAATAAAAPVTAAVSGASAGPAAGARLGETPLVVMLPRSDSAVELQLSKPGFVPLSYKVIPHQDREVVAHLEPVPPPPPPVLALTPRERRLALRRAAAAMAPSMLAAKTARLPSSPAPAPAAAPARAPAPAATVARPAAPAAPVSARR